jgi:hypothetical protein
MAEQSLNGRQIGSAFHMMRGETVAAMPHAA